jgi:large subunit ribosomal protein L24
MVQINPKLIHVPKHQRDRMMGAPLADALRDQYKKKKTLRVVKGDSVRVFRGEYKGVEGKVEKVNTEQGTLHIEGVQRTKIRGGQVKVPIHASNVMIINLNLDDKYRSNKLGGEPEPSEKRAAAAAKKEEEKEDKEE